VTALKVFLKRKKSLLHMMKYTQVGWREREREIGDI
jgi:hypothetical protein